MAAINSGLQLAIYLVLGIICRKFVVKSNDFSALFSKLLLAVSIPASVLYAFTLPYTPEQLQGAGTSLLVGLLLFGLSTVVALLVRLATRKKDGYAMILAASLMFCNFSFFGYPFIESLYGAEGLFYFGFVSLPGRIAIYTVLPMMFAFSRGKSLGVKGIFKELLTPALLAVPVGFLLFAFRVELPPFLSSVVKSLNDTCFPFGIMLAGMMMAEAPREALLREKRVFLVAFVRNLLLPALSIPLLLAMRLDPLIFKLGVLYLALPIAAVVTIYAVGYDKEPTGAAASVLVSTFLSVVTLPVWAYVVEWIH